MMTAKKILCLVLAMTLTVTFTASAYASADREIDNELQAEIDTYNYIIGTSAFSPGYQFTDKDPVIELADAIEAWGSNMIKFNARSDDTLVDRVLDGRDYDYVFMWYRSNGSFRDGYSADEARADYNAVYAFTKKLLTTYNDTGKQFYLGHWEGDWYYLDDKTQQKVDDTVTEGMIDWLNNRQKAVDDAKRDTPHENVYVWNYLEVNRVYDAFKNGYDRVVNRVLPFTNVDYVSYSSYDVMLKPAREVDCVIRYIYKNLPQKDGVPGARVFIGEAAQAARVWDYNDALHCEDNLNIIAKYLRCDAKFVLYWQMYCNETLDDGTNNGFWLIDESGNKTMLYQKLETLFEDGKAYVRQFAKENGRVPTDAEYSSFLLHHPILKGAGTGFRALRITLLRKLYSLFNKICSLLHTDMRFKAEII